MITTRLYLFFVSCMPLDSYHSTSQLLLLFSSFVVKVRKLAGDSQKGGVDNLTLKESHDMKQKKRKKEFRR